MIPLGQHPDHTGQAVIPAPGESYRHYKGSLYTIVATATDEATLQPVVVYRSRQDCKAWVRTLHNFLEWVDTEGGRVPRFKREVMV